MWPFSCSYVTFLIIIDFEFCSFAYTSEFFFFFFAIWLLANHQDGKCSLSLVICTDLLAIWRNVFHCPGVLIFCSLFWKFLSLRNDDINLLWWCFRSIQISSLFLFAYQCTNQFWMFVVNANFHQSM